MLLIFLSTVLITGASRGIGRATAKAFANSGWDLLLLARSEDDLEKLAERVLLALKDVVSLMGKLTDSDRTLPEGLPEMPRELSFWVAAHLGGPVADEQQHLLEMQDTTNRLLREYEMLDHTRKQLAARTALKDTLKNTDQANT